MKINNTENALPALSMSVFVVYKDFITKYLQIMNFVVLE